MTGMEAKSPEPATGTPPKVTSAPVVLCPECGTPASTQVPKTIRFFSSKIPELLILGVLACLLAVELARSVRYDSSFGTSIISSEVPLHALGGLTAGDLRQFAAAGAMAAQVEAAMHGMLQVQHKVLPLNRFAIVPASRSGYEFSTQSIDWPSFWISTTTSYDFDDVFSRKGQRPAVPRPAGVSFTSPYVHACWNGGATGAMIDLYGLMFVATVLIFVSWLGARLALWLQCRFRKPSGSRQGTLRLRLVIIASVLFGLSCLAVITRTSRTVINLRPTPSATRACIERDKLDMWVELTDSEWLSSSRSASGWRMLAGKIESALKEDIPSHTLIGWTWQNPDYDQPVDRLSVGWPFTWFVLSSYEPGPSGKFGGDPNPFDWRRPNFNLGVDPTTGYLRLLFVDPFKILSFIGLSAWLVWHTTGLVLWIAVRHRWKRRLLAGRCAACGYDLRGLEPARPSLPTSPGADV